MFVKYIMSQFCFIIVFFGNNNVYLVSLYLCLNLVNYCFLVILFFMGIDVTLSQGLVHYKCRFGHLACFTSDIEMFLQVLTHNEKTELLEQIMEVHESPSVSPAKALGQAMTSFRIQESTGVIFRLPAIGMLYFLIYCISFPHDLEAGLE